MGVTGQQPTAVGLFAIDRHPMPRELHRFSAGSRLRGQGIPAPRIRDLVEHGDLLNLAHTMNPGALMTFPEAVEKFMPAKRLIAWIQKHHIVRHQGEQSLRVARIDGIDPGAMNFAYRALIISPVHLSKIPAATSAAMGLCLDRHMQFVNLSVRNTGRWTTCGVSITTTSA